MKAKTWNDAVIEANNLYKKLGLIGRWYVGGMGNEQMISE